MKNDIVVISESQALSIAVYYSDGRQLGPQGLFRDTYPKNSCKLPALLSYRSGIVLGHNGTDHYFPYSWVRQEDEGGFAVPPTTT